MLHLPFVITVCLVVVMMVLLYRFMGFNTIRAEVEKPSKIPIYILLLAVGLLLDKTATLATKHGLWDAWSIWNYDVKFLSDPGNWKRLFENTALGHPDYPFALPASLAFFNRLLDGHLGLQTGFAFHFLVTLCIPMLIYIETYRRSWLWAAIVLYLFVTNDDYVSQGVSQLADALLALFLLCAFIAADNGKGSRNMLTLTAFFLGCCMWTKNEGIVIACIFTLFNMRLFFNRSNIGYFTAGIALPLIALILFKVMYAPPNDIVSAQGATTLGYLTQPDRYILIMKTLYDNLSLHYFGFSLIIGASILWSALKKQMTDNRMLIILTCGLAYFMIYVLNHNELEWQLHTSQTRLILHLIPSAIYIVTSMGSDKPKQGFQVKFFSSQRHLQ